MTSQSQMMTSQQDGCTVWPANHNTASDSIHKYSPPTLTEFMPTGLGVIEPDIAVLWKVQFYVYDKSWYVRN